MNISSFKDIFAVETLIRGDYESTEEGINYRAKIYESILGKPTVFGSVKNQSWKIYSKPHCCLFASVRENGKNIYLCFLVVERGFRNQGLASGLLEEVMESLSIEYSPERFTLTCRDHLTGFYEKRGFKITFKRNGLNYMTRQLLCTK